MGRLRRADELVAAANVRYSWRALRVHRYLLANGISEVNVWPLRSLVPVPFQRQVIMVPRSELPRVEIPLRQTGQ
jgi:hypothetical protein